MAGQISAARRMEAEAESQPGLDSQLWPGSGQNARCQSVLASAEGYFLAWFMHICICLKIVTPDLSCNLLYSLKHHLVNLLPRHETVGITFC